MLALGEEGCVGEAVGLALVRKVGVAGVEVEGNLEGAVLGLEARKGFAGQFSG